MPDPLLSVQQDIAHRLKSADILRSVPVFSDVPRSEEEAAMIIETINKALAGLEGPDSLIGMAIIIPMPAFRVDKPDVPGVIGEAVVTVQVLENIMLNRGPQGIGMTCESVAWAVACLGHQLLLKPNQLLFTTSMEMQQNDREQSEIEADIIWNVEFRLRADVEGFTACDIPRISHDSETELVTITTATEGATILVTTDGSYPATSNPVAVPYDNPFTAPASGSSVRATAVKPGLADSGANEIIIP